MKYMHISFLSAWFSSLDYDRNMRGIDQDGKSKVSGCILEMNRENGENIGGGSYKHGMNAY